MTLKQRYDYILLMHSEDPYWDPDVESEQSCKGCGETCNKTVCSRCFVDSLPGVRHTINSP